MFAEMMRRPFGLFLMAAVLAALLCLFPVRVDAPQEERTAQQDAPQDIPGVPAGADLSARTGDACALHTTTYYEPCGHSVQQRGDLPAQLKGLTRSALEEDIGGVLPGAQVTGFDEREVDVSVRAAIPCPLHWVLADGGDGMLHVLQNRTGDALSVVRGTDVPLSAVPQEERQALTDGRIFDSVQALEGYLESLSS